MYLKILNLFALQDIIRFPFIKYYQLDIAIFDSLNQRV